MRRNQRTARAAAMTLTVTALSGCGGGKAVPRPETAAEIRKPAAEAPPATTRAPRGESVPAATAPATEPATAAAGGPRPEETVIAYLKAGADGDPRACRLFTQRGLRRFLREFAQEDGAKALEACEELFELVAHDGDGTVEVGGRELTADQVEGVRLDVERRVGSDTALVSGPGAHARLVLVEGRWLIDSVEETG